MVRRVLVLVLAFVAVSLGAPSAAACSCAAVGSLREAVERSEVAFAGEVVRSRGGGYYLVRVHGVLKGRVGERVRMSARGGFGDSCGRRALGRGPIVFAGSRELDANACAPVWTGDRARAELAASGLPTAEPDPGLATIGPRGPGARYWARWAAAIAVVVAAARAMARRRPVYST